MDVEEDTRKLVQGANKGGRGKGVSERGRGEGGRYVPRVTAAAILGFAPVSQITGRIDLSLAVMNCRLF